MASALLAGVVVVHIDWAPGGTWALHAFSRIDDTGSAGGRIFLAVFAVLAVPVALELLALARLPCIRFPVSRRLV